MNAALVEVAVGALVHFASPVDRSDAEYFLGLWPRSRELSDEDRTAVLDRFGPEREPVAGLDWLPVLTGNESLGILPMIPPLTPEELAGPVDVEALAATAVAS